MNSAIIDLCQIRGTTIYGGDKPRRIIQISPGKNQISADFMYIENIQLIGIYKIIADIKPIS